IDDLCVDALGVPDPAAPSVGPAHTKGRLVSFRVANFLETQDAINIVIVVGRDDRAILAVAFAGAFLGTGPAAMVAAPMHQAVRINGDAEHLVRPMGVAAAG